MTSDLFSTSINRPTVVEGVIEQIKTLLIEDKLKPGDLIPSEQTIANSLNIGRGSVREAMKILSALGIVEIKRGEGTFISSASNKKIMDSQMFPLLVQKRDYKSLVEIRSILEEGIVKLLIDEATDEELADLRKVCIELETKIDNHCTLEETNLCDIRYHRLMGKYTHNAIVENMYSFITDLFRPTINSKEDGTYDIHLKLQDALERRDRQAALECIEIHTRIWAKNAQRHGDSEA